MKVIDLLNKIANGEEVPKKFMVDGDTLYIGEDKFIEYANGERIEWFIYPSWLNEEVETIKEDKKIEKIKNINCESFRDNHNGIRQLTDIEIASDIITLKEWINKIIDKLNEEDK